MHSLLYKANVTSGGRRIPLSKPRTSVARHVKESLSVLRIGMTGLYFWTNRREHLVSSDGLVRFKSRSLVICVCYGLPDDTVSHAFEEASKKVSKYEDMERLSFAGIGFLTECDRQQTFMAESG